MKIELLFAFLLFALCEIIDAIEEKSLHCQYGRNTLYLWPTYTYCWIHYPDLQINNKNLTHVFSGTNEQKLATTKVTFQYVSKVDFIPTEIFNEFPNINGIEIAGSNLPILSNDLLTNDFRKIEHIAFLNDKIRKIENSVFDQLNELQWLHLGFNEIESLDAEIFRNNLKLQFINLSDNKIKIIHPKLFQNLDNLVEVNLWQNECIGEIFGCQEFWCNGLADMKNDLKQCHDNCISDPVCNSNNVH